MKSYIQRIIAAGTIICLVLAVAGCKTTTTKTNQNTIGISQTSVKFLRPAAPGPLVATGQDGSVSLTWTLDQRAKTLPLTLYRWQSGGLPAVLKTLPAGQASFTDTGLTNGTKYFYLIIVKDENGIYSNCTANVCAIPVAPPRLENIESGISSDATGDYNNDGGGQTNEDMANRSHERNDRLVCVRAVITYRCQNMLCRTVWTTDAPNQIRTYCPNCGSWGDIIHRELYNKYGELVSSSDG